MPNAELKLGSVCCCCCEKDGGEFCCSCNGGECGRAEEDGYNGAAVMVEVYPVEEVMLWGRGEFGKVGRVVDVAE